MPVFKNTLDILTNPWSYQFDQENVSVSRLPNTYNWTGDSEITVDDVVLWEQLFYEPGNVGIYVSYKPYADLYVITYNLFFETDQKFETFVGDQAGQNCLQRASNLGIILDSIIKS